VRLFRFIYESYSFRRLVIISCVFAALTLISSFLFDFLWGKKTSVPVINLNDVYNTPVTYDNITRVNLKLISKHDLVIEGNKKFKVIGSNKHYNYYDTLKVDYPSEQFDYTNKYYLNFEDTSNLDSIYLVVSRSDSPDIYYKQIFYSSVSVKNLNDFPEDLNRFRIHHEKLVNNLMLENNDSLINKTIRHFGSTLDTSKLEDCGANSNNFKIIADLYNLPCRVISLQGGDDEQTGYYNFIGYPLHVVCEVYSSRLKKWYVIDPTYGLRFKYKNSDIYFNAVEICYQYTFNADHDILQDPVLQIRRSTIGRDYFKFYENIYYTLKLENDLLKKILNVFYSSLSYEIYHYSNFSPPMKNGFYYVGLKSFMYFIIIIIYINSVLIIIANRLFKAKKPAD